MWIGRRHLVTNFFMDLDTLIQRSELLHEQVYTFGPHHYAVLPRVYCLGPNQPYNMGGLGWAANVHNPTATRSAAERATTAANLNN